MKTLVSVLVGLTAMSGATAALAAEIPPGCKVNSLATRAYQSGVYQGMALVESAWNNNMNNCDTIDAFADIVYNDLLLYQLSGTSAYSICRFTGLHDGAEQELVDIGTSCDWMCCLEGNAIGKMAGEVYCQLSIVLGGLAKPDSYRRKPVYVCGLEFELCCDSVFDGTTQDYVGLDLDGNPVACSPTYTDDPFHLVCQETRNFQCDYQPPPPPQTKSQVP